MPERMRRRRPQRNRKQQDRPPEPRRASSATSADQFSRPARDDFDLTPHSMPPGPAGADAPLGGEPSASRRHVQLPPQRPAARRSPVGEKEPFLGYDGLDMDGVLDWIREADPETKQLREILAYERVHRDRSTIVQACMERIRRLSA